METRRISEHELALVQEEELLDNVASLISHFKIKYLFAPETSVDLSEEVISKKKMLELVISECKQNCTEMTVQTDTQEWLSQFEDTVGVLERDEAGNIHCGKIMVSWRFCQDLIGCTVRVSNISLNTRNTSRTSYSVFANHVEVIAYPVEEMEEFFDTNEETDKVLSLEIKKEEEYEVSPQEITNDDADDVFIPQETEEYAPGTYSDEIEFEYGLETTIEVFEALVSRIKKLASHTEQHRQISMEMSTEKDSLPDYTHYEGFEGLLERDEDGNIHLGDCMVSFNFAKNLVGKKVMISSITVNTKLRANYPFFAKHIELIDETDNN